jgi:hypothetical protein
MPTIKLYKLDVKEGFLPNICCSCDQDSAGLKKLKFTRTPLLTQMLQAGFLLLYPWIVTMLRMPKVSFVAWVYMLLKLRASVKREELLLPVCQRHMKPRMVARLLRNLCIGSVTVLLCSAAFFIYVGNRYMAVEMALGALTVLIMVGPIALLAGEFGIKATDVTEESIIIKGVSNAFVEAVHAMADPVTAQRPMHPGQGQIVLASAKYYRPWERRRQNDSDEAK